MTSFRCARCQRTHEGEPVLVGARLVCDGCSARAALTVDRTRALDELQHEATCEPTPVVVSQVVRVRGAPMVALDRSRIKSVRER